MDAVQHLSIDIETYSGVDLKKVGLYHYAQSPTFEILLVAYSLNGGPVQVIDLARGEQLPDFFCRALTDPRYIKHAFNAAFEWYCFGQALYPDNMQFWLSTLPQWRCTMIHAVYCGYPGKLRDTGPALGLPQDKRKLATGDALIRYFCKPCKPTRKNGWRERNRAQDDLEKWAAFVEYNRQDVVTEMEIGRRLAAYPVPDDVWQQWRTDQAINARGVAVDRQMIWGAVALDNAARDALVQEAQELTDLGNPNSAQQLMPWLAAQTGAAVTNLRKDTVADMLAVTEDAKARRMLEIRQELSKTSNKKYEALWHAVCADGRVRGMLQFYGAGRTGRWAGRFAQPQNLPRTHLDPALIPMGRQYVRDVRLDAMRVVFGSVSDTLSQLIRTAFIAAPGAMLVDADFSAIEARVIAWLAGENWVLDVFRSHGKIYEATAAQMFHVPIEKIKKGEPEYELRQKGKIATLALGYGGGTGAMTAMGALRMGIPESDLQDIVNRWREANRAIVQFWYDLELAAKEALRSYSSVPMRNGSIVVAYECDNYNTFLTIRLPSGRKLYYVNPHMGVDRWGRESLCYWGVNYGKWAENETYGGKLAENVTQAVARDCLANAIERLTDAGFPIVFHVHDEVIAEVPGGTDADLARMIAIMRTPPDWARDLPLNADGWVDSFFKKE